MRNSNCYALYWYLREEEPSSGLRVGHILHLERRMPVNAGKENNGLASDNCVPLTHIESYKDYLCRSVYT